MRAGWFVCYRCGCSDFQPEHESMPEKCPTHDSERVNPPEQLTAMPGIEYGFWGHDAPLPPTYDDVEEQRDRDHAYALEGQRGEA